MFLAALNTEIFKYTIFVLATPMWLPFLKALIRELDDALAAEGGLFGRPPSKQEIAFIERDPNRAKSPLVSHDFDPDRPGATAPGQTARRASTGSARGGSAAASAGGGSSGQTAMGFSKPRGVRGFSRKDQRGR